MKKFSLLMLTLTILVTVMAQDEKQTFTRKVLIEQFTGAACGWCPWGAERIDSAITNPNNVVWVKHHAGFGDDFLTNEIHTAMTRFYASSLFAPAVMFDRTHMNSSRPGPVMSVGVVSELRRLITTARGVTTTCKVYTPEVFYNPDTRHLSGQVRGRFGDESYDESTRIVVYLIEDSIVGRQSDYINGTQNAFVHMGTVRAALTDMWGDLLDVDPSSEHSFSYTIDYTLPSDYVPKNCRLVALVWQYDPDDVNNCPVLNAAQSDYLGNSLAIGEVAAACDLRLFPNPAHDQVVVQLADMQPSECHIDLIDAAGRRLVSRSASGSSAYQLSLQGLPAGLYLLRVTTPNGIATRQLLKQ